MPSPTGQTQGFEGPLAEFVALREQILDRAKGQQQMLTLQLTLSGGIFGFSVSKHSMTALLLIVPFSSYLLCGRLVNQHFSTVRAAKYIREELSPRIPGGLHWEEWLDQPEPRAPNPFGVELPLFITFVGASLLSLTWSLAYVLTCSGMTTMAKIGLIAVWSMGLTITGLSVVLLLQRSGRLTPRLWPNTGRSVAGPVEH